MAGGISQLGPDLGSMYTRPLHFHIFTPAKAHVLPIDHVFHALHPTYSCALSLLLWASRGLAGAVSEGRDRLLVRIRPSRLPEGNVNLRTTTSQKCEAVPRRARI